MTEYQKAHIEALNRLAAALEGMQGATLAPLFPGENDYPPLSPWPPWNPYLNPITCHPEWLVRYDQLPTYGVTCTGKIFSEPALKEMSTGGAE